MRTQATLNVMDYSLFGTAIDGLSAKQVALALSTQNLSQAQLEEIVIKNDLLAKYGAEELIKTGLLSANSSLLASEKAVSAEKLQEAIIENALNKEKAEGFIQTHLETIADGEEVASTVMLNKALMDEMVKRGILSEEKANEILQSFGIVSGDVAETASKSALTKATWELVKAQAAQIATSPVGMIALAIGAGLGLMAIYDGLTTSLSEAQENLEDSMTAFNETTDEINSLNEELKTTEERIKELQKLSDAGTISIADETELEILKEQNKELARQIALKQRKQITESKEVLKDAQELSGKTVRSKYDFDSTNRYEATVGKQVSVEDELQLAINAYEEYKELLKDDTVTKGQRQIYESAFLEAEARVDEMYSILEAERQAYLDLEEAGYTLSPKEKERLEYLNGYNDIFLLWNHSLTQTKESFASLDVEQQRSILLNRLLKQGLSETDAQSVLGSISDTDLSEYWDKDFSFEPPILTDYATAEEYGKAYAEAWLNGVISKTQNPDEITVSFSVAFNSADFSEQKEKLLDLAKAGELTEETLSSTEEYKTLLDDTGLSAESAKDKIYELLTAQEKLAGAHNGLDDLSNSYKEFKDLGFVTAQTLEGLPDVFKSLEGFDVFSQIVGNPESGVDAIQNAFNDIVKEYLLFIQTLNENDLISNDFETQQRAINTYIANLKQMGITNAEEVVKQTVSSMKQQQTLLDNAEQEYIDYLRGNEEDYMGYLKAKNNIDLQYIESTASYNSQFINSLGQGYETDYNNWLGLLRDKELAYQRYVKSLDGDGDGEFIYDPNKDVAGNLIANGKDASASNIVDFYTAKAEYERISKKYEDLRNTLSFNPVFSNNFSANWDGSSLSSGSGSKNSDNEFDWIETKLDILNDKLEKTKETAQDSFSDWIDRDKAFKDADKQIDDLIAKQKEAKARYLAEARKVGLTEKDENGISYTTLIQQGAIDIDKISNDTLKEKIQSYQEYWDKVKECDEAVVQLNKDSLQLDRDYREFKWEIFDYLQDSISRLTDEADYLIELLSNKDLFDNNGNLTKYADATLGLHISNYKTYMQKASDYAEEIKDLEKQLANGGQEVLDKYNERIDAHQDAILAAQQEKQAMLDLVEQGYQKQLDALNEAIDKKKELWNIEKGLFDYQQSIAEKTKNIAILEKRKFALSGDSSQEAKAQLQQIEVELSEARKDLEQTEYEKMISDQEQMLDQLSSDYEEWINQRIDNSDSLLQQIINNLSADGEISKTLKEIAGSYGTNISKDLLTSVSGNTNNAINNLVNNISKLLGGNTTLIGNVGGYASGTTSATKGLHWFNENGNEIIIRKADGAVLGNFDQGDVVISNEGAKLLSAFSQDPTAFMEKFGFSNYIQPMVNVNIPKIPNIERLSNQAQINNTTHMEVILPNVTNYDDFMNRMQNDKRFDNIVTTSMNSKMTGSNSLSKFRF